MAERRNHADDMTITMALIAGASGLLGFAGEATAETETFVEA